MTRTVFVRAVYPVVKRTGTRFDVVLVGDHLPWNADRIPYIWDNGVESQLLATRLKKAAEIHKAVALTTKQTMYGEEITGAELVPEYTELAS